MSDFYSSFEGYSRKELRHALKRADTSIFDQVLRYLEADPNYFVSGYAKELIWQNIRRYSLQARDIQRLEQAALKYLQRPMRPEYKRMCQTLGHIGTASFWQEVEKHLDSENPITRVNAYCLYQYSEGLEAGERARLQLKRLKRDIHRKYWENKARRYGPYFYGSHVLEAVINPSVWKDMQIVYREPDENDLPIQRNGGGTNELASLDFSHCKVDEVIEALNPILVNGKYSDASFARVFVFYVFGELGSNKVLPIIEDFYATRISHQFDSGIKWYTTQAIYRALKRINTPEALQLLKKYEYPDTPLARHMKTFITGWLVNDRNLET